MTISNLFPDYEAYKSAGFAGLNFAKPTVMIAFTARTGSTHLCAAFHQAGYSHAPSEIFNPRGPVQEEAWRLGAKSFASYFEGLSNQPDDVFIFKTCWQDVEPFAPALCSIFPNLRVVYLSRRNDAAQAVSAFKAELSGTWHRYKGDAAPSEILETDFSLLRLLTIHEEQMKERQNWQRWFAANGITPLKLVYEAFEDDVNIALQALVPTLGLPLASQIPQQTGLQKLADAQSRSWTQKLQRSLLNLG